MTSKFTYLVALTYVFLTSCSTDLVLLSEAQVLDHSSCDSEESALVLLSAKGEGPYFYEVYDANDNSVFSEVREEASIEIQLENLQNINYRYSITDQNMDISNGHFQVMPSGQSSIKSKVLMQGSSKTGAVYLTEIILFIEDNGELVKFDIQSTDSEGNYSFEGLPSGNFAIEINLPNKYNDYRMEAFNSEGNQLVKAGSNRTELIPLSCVTDLDLEVVFTK